MIFKNALFIASGLISMYRFLITLFLIVFEPYIKSIQSKNGELGANRYIISNNQTALNVMQLYAMLKLVAFNDKLSIDIVPLFETVNDLENAPKVMAQLYKNKAYKAHLRSRGHKQTIMLVFSDCTKDGGYFMTGFSKPFNGSSNLLYIKTDFDGKVSE